VSQKTYTQRFVLWIGLGGILLLYGVSVARLHPTNFFGLTEDDSFYFSSAQALAQGKGYILPNLPWAPAATKYPMLYPWCLSWVWRWNPSFPANLTLAIGMTVVFGLAFIALTFVFLRQLKILTDPEALLLTAFCAMHPVVLFYSGQIMTEIPFSASALAALVLGQVAIRRDAHPGWAVGCGIVTGFSVLFRVLGVPILGGILIAAMVRKAWRQAAILVSFAAPFFCWQVWKSVSAARFIPPTDKPHSGPGFLQTWTYHMSYFGIWKLHMENIQVLGSMLRNQLIYLLTHVPGFFLGSFFDGHIGFWFVATLLVLAAIVSGLIRTAKTSGWQPVYFALMVYIGIILVWDYPEIQRFLIPFLPLFAVALWLEAKWIVSELGSFIRNSRTGTEKAVAMVLSLAGGALAAFIIWNFIANKDRTQLQDSARKRSSLLAEKLEAYDWIRQNTKPNARIVAGEDGCMYLYTGRQSMSFIALSRAAAYDPSRLQIDLDHMTDVAHAIDAQYWVASSDDSVPSDWKSAKPFVAARLNQIESVLPELFHSSAGHVRIYDPYCIQKPEASACMAVDGVLFPMENVTNDQRTVAPLHVSQRKTSHDVD
jgi:hypothetical protein